MAETRKRNFSEIENAGDAKSNLPIIVKLVCPHERSGSVIGRGGEFVKNIRATTGARVKIEDLIPGEKERAVTVSGPDRPGEPSCPTQEGIKRVIARIIEQEGPDGNPTIPNEIEVQLIVDRAFVGQIVGKGGANVLQIRSQSGATVTTLQHVNTPLVAPEEQLIKVSGSLTAVNTAVHLIIEKVRLALSRGQIPAALQATSGAPGMPHVPASVPVPPVYGGAPGPSLMVESVYRMLLVNTRIGTLIGKGGENLKRIKSSTGADIVVEQKVGDFDEQIVVCKSQEPAEAQACGAAEGLMRVAQHALHEKPQQNADGALEPPATVTKQVKLVAQAKQMGSIIGLKGSTIKRIASDTRTKLSVIRGDLPAGMGSPHDEILLIEGKAENILSSVRICTMLLRGIMVKQQGERSMPGAGPTGPPMAPGNPWARPGAPAHLAAPPAMGPPTMAVSPANHPPTQPPVAAQPSPYAYAPGTAPPPAAYSAPPVAAAPQTQLPYATVPSTASYPYAVPAPAPAAQPAPPTATTHTAYAQPQSGAPTDPYTQQYQQAYAAYIAAHTHQAPAQSQPAQPTAQATYSSAAPASSTAYDAATLAAQMYGSYQQPAATTSSAPQTQATSQPQSQGMVVALSNGTTSTTPASSQPAPTGYSYAQPSQLPQGYTYGTQPYSYAAPAPSPAPGTIPR